MMTSSVRKKIEEEWPSSQRLESDSEREFQVIISYWRSSETSDWSI